MATDQILTLPPLLSGHPVAPPVAEEAATGAAEARYGAGDLCWHAGPTDLTGAIVLEPELPARAALAAALVAMVAFADALGVLAPPEVGVTYRWPGTLLVNGAAAGSVGARLPAGIDGEAVPDWMVIDLRVDLRDAGREEPGNLPDRTTLSEEGCGHIGPVALLECYARHLMAGLHGFETEGIAAAHRSWAARCPDIGKTVTVPTAQGPAEGKCLGLDEEGGVLLRSATGTRLVSFFDMWAP